MVTKWDRQRLAGLTDAQLAAEADARADSRNMALLEAIQNEQLRRRHEVVVTAPAYSAVPTLERTPA